MLDLNYLKQHIVEPPDFYTAFGSKEDLLAMPQTHRDQIHFLDKEAAAFSHDLLNATDMLCDIWGGGLDKKYFRSIEIFRHFSDEAALKKWLYHRSIPFSRDVILLAQQAILTTWKMIVKYPVSIFFANDVVVFDASLNWCLYYFHHDEMFFGKDYLADAEHGYEKMEAINELKRLYPHITFPY